MRRTLLVFFIFLLVGVGLALLFREHSGYVQLAWGNWRVETSLLFFLAALAVAVWILILVWRTLMAGARLPARLRGMLTRRRERKAQRSLHKGLLLLFEGRWADAERTLLRHAERGRNTGINYLSAAHAAQRQDAAERRDRYIEQAAGRRASSELAVLLTQASLQMQQGQDAEALATLARLRETHPEHPPVVTLLADLCERVGDWAQIRELLPVLRKLELVSAERWRALAVAAWGERLTSCENEPSTLPQAWRELPRHLRREPALQRVYADQLRAAGNHREAAALIDAALKQAWTPALVLIYGDLDLDKPTEQLATVERWLKQYGNRNELQLVAGRLCLRNRLWGRARSYLEATLQGPNRAQAQLALGRLFEAIEQPPDALQAYREGLEAAVRP